MKIYTKSSIAARNYEVLSAVQEIIHDYCDRHKIKFFQGPGEQFKKMLVEQRISLNSGASLDPTLCVRIWTNRKDRLNDLIFSSILNEAIRLDDASVMRHVVTVGKGIDELCMVNGGNSIDVKWPDNNVVYRGSGLPEDKKDFYSKGTCYRVPMYFATSVKKNVALEILEYLSPSLQPVLWYIHFSREQNFRVNYISSKNNDFETESDEFLFEPYSAFKVRSVNWKSKPTWKNPHELHLDAFGDSLTELGSLTKASWC